MKRSNRLARWIAGPLTAVLLVSAVAPAAHAGHDRGRRYKHEKSRYVHRVVTRCESPGSVYVVRRSSAGPAVAGFLGGLFLGATLAHAAPAGYFYHDPYCDRRFASLEVYRSHLRRHHHPRIVRVIDIDSGECVRTSRYHDGHWEDWDEY
jgi:hypothetical protein